MDTTNNKQLPEKSCTIERLVTIPEDIKKVINHEKTATRRNGIYADIGEVMVLEGKQFKVDHIYSQKLGEMTDKDAQEEGYSSFEEYKQSILSIHPGMKWQPEITVWVHEYKQVE